MVQPLMKLLGFAHALANSLPFMLVNATPITHGRSHVLKNMKVGMRGWGCSEEEGFEQEKGRG